MNKKGFTLIELLAVILILGVIALVAIPTVTTVVNTIKSRANVASTKNIISAAGKYHALSLLRDDNREKLDGETNVLSELEVDHKPEIGEVYIDIEGNISVALLYDDKCYVKSFDSEEIHELEEFDNCGRAITETINPENVLVSMEDYGFPKVTSVPSRTKRVLVIEIDPYLTTKSKKVSSFLRQSSNVNTMLSNLENDISYASNNNVKIEIVGRETLDEFPTYTEQVTLLNGTKSYRFDEETYLSVFGSGWYGWWNTTNADFLKMDAEKLFDYEYLINKFDLINRKNNNEFDEVWMISIDPVSAYETIMVGRTAYWINGKAIQKDCDNFVITGFTISRVDSPLECLAHATENIMDEVFRTDLKYTKDYMQITSSNYDQLNLWQKFTLTEYANKNKGTNLGGVGNVHFAPNSTADYDWLNETYIMSNWIDWKNNYPNLKGETALVNYATWNSTKDSYYDGRYYQRWWFSLMPHVSGVTEMGYSNNWWDYLYTYDYVVSVLNEAGEYTYTYQIGDKVNNIVVNNRYQSKKKDTQVLKTYQPNMIFSDKSLFQVNGNGEIIAAKKGTTTLKYYRDGKFATYTIKIE